MENKIRAFIKEYVGNSYSTTAYAIIFSILQSLLLIPSVYLINVLFDQNIPDKNLHGLLLNSSLIILINILQALFSIIHQNSFIGIVKEAVRTLQIKLIDKLVKAEYSSTIRLKNNELITRTVEDIHRIDMMLSGILGIIIPQSILFIAGVGIMLYYNPIIGVTTLILGSIGIVIQRVLRKKVLSLIRSYVDKRDKLAGYIDSFLGKQLLIKMRNNELEEVENGNYLSKQLTAIGMQTAKSGFKRNVINELIINISATLLIVIGSVQILLDATTFGNIFGLYFLIVFIRRTVTQLASQATNLNEGSIALEKVNELINKVSIKKPSSPSNKNEPFEGALKMEAVSFGYKANKIVLEQINFHIQKGEIVLISGVNGSGKSTIIDLLLGFIQPVSGRLYADQIDYTNKDFSQLRTDIGYVPQKQYLIEGTLQDNLFYGIKGLDSKTIESLPKSELYKQLLGDLSLDYLINATQHNLSGGQIQKIAIMRALIINPSLLIMDEPTNHLDYKTIIQLIKIIKRESDAGILIVSHHQVFEKVTDRRYLLNQGVLQEVIQGEE